MNSKDKIRSYYVRKGGTNYTKRLYSKKTKSNKFFIQIVFSVMVIAIFNIFLKLDNINYFNKIIDKTKIYLENSINLDTIEAFANNLKIFTLSTNNSEENVQIDQNLLEELKEEAYSESIKK